MWLHPGTRRHPRVPEACRRGQLSSWSWERARAPRAVAAPAGLQVWWHQEGRCHSRPGQRGAQGRGGPGTPCRVTVNEPSGHSAPPASVYFASAWGCRPFHAHCSPWASETWPRDFRGRLPRGVSTGTRSVGTGQFSDSPTPSSFPSLPARAGSRKPAAEAALRRLICTSPSAFQPTSRRKRPLTQHLSEPDSWGPAAKCAPEACHHASPLCHWSGVWSRTAPSAATRCCNTAAQCSSAHPPGFPPQRRPHTVPCGRSVAPWGWKGTVLARSAGSGHWPWWERSGLSGTQTLAPQLPTATHVEPGHQRLSRRRVPP